MEKNINKNIILRILDYVDIQISKFEEFMLAIGVAAMAINTIAAVISRFVFNDSLTFTDELNMIFIILVTFAGLSYAARAGRHIRMSAIYDMLSSKIRKLFMIVMSGVTAGFMFFLAYYSCMYISDVYDSGRILPSLGFPVFYIYLWVPIGFVITGLQYAFTVVKNIRENDVYLSSTVLDGYCDIDTDKEV